ncbi:hypothetical protein FTN78_chr2508 [Lactococcus lactis subsp. lactis bv. diacetylactis]|nr:hypothetical protein [Lactococcus lactis]QEX50133.1 hypothetical protein FTN78_chr2508 [Lactococcus lactis subsp. lactis bv. diacetylactis]
MKFEGTWLVVIILSIEVLAFGEFEQSNQILLIGGISFILSTLLKNKLKYNPASVGIFCL